LQLIGFQGGAGNLSFGGQLRRVEETADGDGSLLGKQQPEFAGELMLAGDPGFVGGGLQVQDCLAADRRGGKASHQGQQRLPLKSGKIGVFHGRRDGIK